MDRPREVGLHRFVRIGRLWSFQQLAGEVFEVSPLGALAIHGGLPADVAQRLVFARPWAGERAATLTGNEVICDEELAFGIEKVGQGNRVNQIEGVLWTNCNADITIKAKAGMEVEIEDRAFVQFGPQVVERARGAKPGAELTS